MWTSQINVSQFPSNPVHSKYRLAVTDNSRECKTKIHQLAEHEKIQIAVERLLSTGQVEFIEEEGNTDFPFETEFIEKVVRVPECMGKKVVIEKVCLSGKSSFFLGKRVSIIKEI